MSSAAGDDQSWSDVPPTALFITCKKILVSVSTEWPYKMHTEIWEKRSLINNAAKELLYMCVKGAWDITPTGRGGSSEAKRSLAKNQQAR